MRHLEGGPGTHPETRRHARTHSRTRTSRQTHTHLRWLTRCTDLPAPHVSEFAAESSVMVGGKPTAAGDQVLGSRDGPEVSCALELQAGWACSPWPSCRPPGRHTGVFPRRRAHPPRGDTPENTCRHQTNALGSCPESFPRRSGRRVKPFHVLRSCVSYGRRRPRAGRRAPSSRFCRGWIFNITHTCFCTSGSQGPRGTICRHVWTPAYGVTGRGDPGCQ